MAKRKQADETSFIDLLNALDEIQRDKGIDKERLISAVEEALISAYKRDYKGAQNARAQIDRQTGQLTLHASREVAETVENPSAQISLEEARALNPLYEPGDFVEEELDPKAFGRLAIQNAKQMVLQRIKDYERNMVYETFSEKKGDLVSGVISRIDKSEVHVEIGRYEGSIPHSQQIPNEPYYQGMRIKVVISDVTKTSKGPQIQLSRSVPQLVSRLFEREIPEIYDGSVEIASIAREPGSRTKIAVRARKSDIDAVGSCIGFKGSRIANILNELGSERIDVVEYSSDPEKYVRNALAPAVAVRVEISEQSRSALAVFEDNQQSLAIGKEGQNVRLAAKLTGYKIDIKSLTSFRSEPIETPSFSITPLADLQRMREDEPS